MRSRLTLALLAAPALVGVQEAHAQFAVNWYTIDGGGGSSSGGTFMVSGTIGQPDAGPAMSGGTFTVKGGFWAGISIPTGGGCCSNDFNHDGDAATDADIEDFFRCIAGNCCPTCDSPDYNCDGDTATDADIESFFRVLAGGSC